MQYTVNIPDELVADANYLRTIIWEHIVEVLEDGVNTGEYGVKYFPFEDRVRGRALVWGTDVNVTPGEFPEGQNYASEPAAGNTYATDTTGMQHYSLVDGKWVETQDPDPQPKLQCRCPKDGPHSGHGGVLISTHNPPNNPRRRRSGGTEHAF